jgi:hypothetical protein
LKVAVGTSVGWVLDLSLNTRWVSRWVYGFVTGGFMFFLKYQSPVDNLEFPKKYYMPLPLGPAFGSSEFLMFTLRLEPELKSVKCISQRS